MFVFSKLFWALVQPSNLLLLLLLVASVCLLRGYRRTGTWLVCGVTAALVVITVLPVGLWLLVPIENRFPAVLPERVDGVIVLGGAVEPHLSVMHDQIVLNDSAERVTALVELAHRYPDARLVVSGGIGSLVAGPGHPARALDAFYRDQGLPPGRVLFEDRSRNTLENALFTKEMVEPGPDEHWLLVTSAYHMPRSIGIFRKAGWPVIAYPVDYRTSGSISLAEAIAQLAQPDVAERLTELDQAAKTWIGLIAYWILGRTSSLLPAP